MPNMFLNNKKLFFLKKMKFMQTSILRKKYIIKSIKKFPFQLKNNYDSIIPLHIYQTWCTKQLPPLMARCVHRLKSNNPRFTHHLYDDNDCREFIKNNFQEDVLNTFDKLVPGAYRADLWRYCMLYERGGIYLDIKYECFNHFKFIHLTESEHFVSDLNDSGIYNALLVCLPGNETLLRAINKIVENVKNNFYGESCLAPTGPLLLSKVICNRQNIDLKHNVINGSFNNRIISYNGKIILKSYNGYLSEYGYYKKTEHYAKLWNERKIYS
jgi:mannosyltransferase OCH1-like enzyme